VTAFKTLSDQRRSGLAARAKYEQLHLSRPWCAVEHLADFQSEGVRGEGFVQERDPRAEDAVVDDGILGVPGHVDDFQGRPLLDQLPGQLRSAGSGHHDVCQQHVDGRVQLEEPQGFTDDPIQPDQTFEEPLPF